MILTSAGKLLFDWRKRAGKTQQQLADAVGVDGSYVARIEMGERRPSRRVIEKLSTALGLSEVETDQFLASAGHLPKGDRDALFAVGLQVPPVYTTIMKALTDENISPEGREMLGRDITEYVEFRLAALKYPAAK